MLISRAVLHGYDKIVYICSHTHSRVLGADSLHYVIVADMVITGQECVVFFPNILAYSLGLLGEVTRRQSADTGRVTRSIPSERRRNVSER